MRRFVKKYKIREMNKSFKIQKYAYDLNKIAVINPNNFKEVFLLKNNILSKKIAKKELSSSTLISSYIPLKYVTTYELSIPRNLIDKIDLYDHIEAHAYEDLDLDETETYIFKYKLSSSPIDEKNIMAEVIILNENNITNYLQPLIEKYNYIDYFGYCGFLFEVLYKKKILTPNKDIFLYFTKEFSAIILYADGEFLQNFVLNEGLISIYEKLNKDSDIEIKDFEYEMFVKLITKKGLDGNYYDDVEQPLLDKLTEIFNAMFMKILNQLNFLQRKFALATIDNIFISTENGMIPGLIDFSISHFGETPVNELKFDTEYNPDNIKIDQLLFLTILSTQYAYQEDYQKYNFTIKKRPPTFFYRKSGQFISLTIASLIFSLLYPSYQYAYSDIKNHENQNLQTKLNNLSLKSNELNSKYNNLLKIYNKEKEVVEKKKKYIYSVENIISHLYKEKKDYVPRSVILSKVLSNMKTDKIHTNSINLNKKILEFNISSEKEYHITDFAKRLVKNEHLDVNTSGIIKDKNSTKYLSTIKVAL